MSLPTARSFRSSAVNSAANVSEKNNSGIWTNRRTPEINGITTPPGARSIMAFSKFQDSIKEKEPNSVISGIKKKERDATSSLANSSNYTPSGRKNDARKSEGFTKNNRREKFDLAPYGSTEYGSATERLKRVISKKQEENRQKYGQYSAQRITKNKGNLSGGTLKTLPRKEKYTKNGYGGYNKYDKYDNYNYSPGYGELDFDSSKTMILDNEKWAMINEGYGERVAKEASKTLIFNPSLRKNLGVSFFDSLKNVFVDDSKINKKIDLAIESDKAVVKEEALETFCPAYSSSTMYATVAAFIAALIFGIILAVYTRQRMLKQIDKEEISKNDGYMTKAEIKGGQRFI